MPISDERMKQIKRRKILSNIALYGTVLLLTALLAFGIFSLVRGMINRASRPGSAEEIYARAAYLSEGYFYDEAITEITGFAKYAENEKLSALLSEIESTKASLVPANIHEVTHVFFHTLIADTSKAFDGDYKENGYNQYMTTISEFREMLRIMHERGYVLVNMDDMAKMQADENGEMRMTPCEILLPPGKKPLVMSQDDVSYYTYMTGDGFATRLVIGEDGYPTNEYIEEDGSVSRGAYDLVPILEDFIKEHPDFSYRGARATLAITGYDGVLGYRTCPSGEGFDPAEIEKAKAVADRMRELGWVFASHSWGHRLYGSIETETLRTDAQKWEDEVEPILGECDVIIYAHGEDIAGIESYTAENEKFQILYDMGFRYFCNVDAHTYWVQVGENYLRQGRRNLDGYRMYHNPELLEDLFPVSEVFDSARPLPVPAI